VTWRRLRPGEIDHEALWLAVSLSAFGGAWIWLSFALPVPDCVFHRLTGFACPTCGVTRCLRYTLHRDWWAALGINPLAFLGFGAVALYDCYAATVLALRLPRLRFDSVSVRLGRFVRFTVIAAILSNWAWLVWRRV
jgi:hypothetical protein